MTRVFERCRWILGKFCFSMGVRYRLKASGKCDLNDELLPSVSGWSLHPGHGGRVVDAGEVVRRGRMLYAN